MSGGEQQRVALARAIVTKPRILLADEPTGALDSSNAANVMEILADLVAEDSAVVIVTHDRELASFTARRVSMLDGRVFSDDRAEPGTPLGPAPSVMHRDEDDPADEPSEAPAEADAPAETESS
jgi:putative ABC transport system ATP-binding protein